jgi:hypothetical protein
MKKLILIPVLLSSACAYNHDIGGGFTAYTTTELFAPSVTVIRREADDIDPSYTQVIGGQSVFGQLSGPASAAVGGYLIGDGLRRSGTQVNQMGGGATQTQSGSLSQEQGQGISFK